MPAIFQYDDATVNHRLPFQTTGAIHGNKGRRTTTAQIKSEAIELADRFLLKTRQRHYRVACNTYPVFLWRNTLTHLQRRRLENG